MLEGRLRRSMVEVPRDNRIRLTALTSPGLVPGDLRSLDGGRFLLVLFCCYFATPDNCIENLKFHVDNGQKKHDPRSQ